MEISQFLERPERERPPETRHVEIFLNRVLLDGDITVPHDPQGIVICPDIALHGGTAPSSAHTEITPHTLSEYETRRETGVNGCAEEVSTFLNASHLATLTVELLNEYERTHPLERQSCNLREHRLRDITHWLEGEPEGKLGPLGYFATDLNSAAALRSAAVIGERIAAVVSYRGRPELAGQELLLVRSPTLLIVPEDDEQLRLMNEEAFHRLCCQKLLKVIRRGENEPYRTQDSTDEHSVRPPSIIKADEVGALASRWFLTHFLRVTNSSYKPK